MNKEKLMQLKIHKYEFVLHPMCFARYMEAIYKISTLQFIMLLLVHSEYVINKGCVNTAIHIEFQIKS